MFYDDDFDYGALLEDDFLLNDNDIANNIIQPMQRNGMPAKNVP